MMALVILGGCVCSIPSGVHPIVTTDGLGDPAALHLLTLSALLMVLLRALARANQGTLVFLLGHGVLHLSP